MAGCNICGAETFADDEVFCGVHGEAQFTALEAPLPTGESTELKPELEPDLPAAEPPRPPGLVGRVLGDRFELKTFLGVGGFGSTYVALDRRLRRECVLKLLKPMSDPPSPMEEGIRRRFENEALALAHLTHPNIVQAYDHGEEPDRTAWIAMEYARGRSLGEVLASNEERPLSRIIGWAQQVAGALAYAHARGIVHRDLKPGNIILVEGGTGGEQVKVLDFGIARIIDPGKLGLGADEAQLTQAGSFFGTPAYMSPEQASGRPVGPESDVYSLGVMIYRMLAGVLPGDVPAEGWNPLNTLHYVLSLPAPIQQHRPDCPKPLAELIHRMMEKEPESRNVTAAQAQALLLAYATTSSGQLAAPTAGLSAALPAPVARNAPGRTVTPLVAAAIAMALVVVIGGGLLVWMRATVSPAAGANTRGLALRGLLDRARSGAKPTEIEGEALGLLKGGSDARLSLARGLARRSAGEVETALQLFDEARVLGEGTPLGAEATRLGNELRAESERSRAQARALAEAEERARVEAQERARAEAAAAAATAAASDAAKAAAKAAAKPARPWTGKPRPAAEVEKDREDFPEY